MARYQHWQDLYLKFKRMEREFEPLMLDATTRATRFAWNMSRRFMRLLIYDVPEDVTAKGKKKWTRKRFLRGSELSRIVNPYLGQLYNDAIYSFARHNLGLSAGHPDIIGPPPTIKRETFRFGPWRAQAIKKSRKQVNRIYRERILTNLRRR